MTQPKWWDIIAPDNVSNENAIRDFYLKNAERWAIAHEIGESGYQHLQTRCVLYKGLDKWGILNELQIRGIGGCEIQPTHVRNFQYVIKTDYYERESDQVILNKCRGEPCEWQKMAIEKLRQQNDREILLVYDGRGNHGKSWLWNRLVGTHQARGIPAFNNAKDIIRCAMAETCRGYAIDTPRSGILTKETWSAIEQVKNGYLYEDRYQWHEKHIPFPKVIVFTNKMPKMNEISEDRWQILDITNCEQF